ncbi:hypothetical protein [Chryseobacterium koreense]|uniref:Uncharacterized protein n=1 Tax=Chryseobacterium koreense CCUG 49689 TaxID=1304281 RepID=A0A0J7LKA0_9FLAO|nr:hypothetical protein [Chryseobacterium koreense]KMQ69490.1 hypothetical protein ACM44_14475 [Chryseobacterium koreense CCUG 49689]MBB5334857.1 hypothetical protein [Chryseobacterium koreense]
MSTEKKYYNEFFKVITEQQANQLGKVYVNHIIEGKLGNVSDLLMKLYIIDNQFDYNSFFKRKEVL